MGQHYLLLGAGFSRNWGGWLASEAFEYLLTCREVLTDGELRRLLWKHRLTGGFEGALEEVQAAARFGGSDAMSRLASFDAAMRQMFDDMNRAFSERAEFEFQNTVEFLLRTFLVRFDAIFTLNQDTLMERHYLNDNIGLSSNGRWSGPQLPGMKPNSAPSSGRWDEVTWSPLATEHFDVQARAQPFFKLHGSSNWVDAEHHRLLVMGGNKSSAIGAAAVLNWYQEEFERALAQPGTRLMVIGYGFRDAHINAAILNGGNHGLGLFVVDPSGADVVNPQRHGQIRPADPLEDLLIGASRRSLRETFGGDAVEHRKLMRFFDS